MSDQPINVPPPPSPPITRDEVDVIQAALHRQRIAGLISAIEVEAFSHTMQRLAYLEASGHEARAWIEGLRGIIVGGELAGGAAARGACRAAKHVLTSFGERLLLMFPDR